MPPDELKEGSPGLSDVLLVISTAYEERTRDFLVPFFLTRAG